jgi:putative SOS response-associated peptidase YedK
VIRQLQGELCTGAALEMALWIDDDHPGCNAAYGNLPPLPGVSPDQLAPVVRLDRDGKRALELMRWGFSPLSQLGNRPVTNIRNVASPYWRGWIKLSFRCLVPARSFCEYTDGHPKVPHWFTLGADRLLFAFAGIWRPWTGARGTKAEWKALSDKTGSENREHLLFGFLTTGANDGPFQGHAGDPD